MKLLPIVLLFGCFWTSVQSIDPVKVDALCHAIAKVEGFGKPRTLPTRLHNPGDLKSGIGVPKLKGQKGVDKAGHIIFATDAAGWAALHDYVLKIVEGRSKRYRPTTTLTQMSKVYAQNWRPWAARVAHELDVSPDIRIIDFVQKRDFHKHLW